MTREQSQARTRDRLVQSAKELVAREGYESASIDRIAEEAGYSKGAFYSNFASKEELFLQLLEEHAGEDLVELEQLIGDEADAMVIIDRLSAWSHSRAHDRSNGLLVLELVRRAQRDATFGNRHATLYLPQWEGVCRILLRLFADGSAPADPATLGGIFMELTYGIASTFSAGPQVEQLVKVALSAMHLAHGRKQPPAPAQRPRAVRIASSRG